MLRPLVIALIVGILPVGASADGVGNHSGSPRGIEIGGAVAVTPTYEGSSSYRALAVPFIAPSFGGDKEGGILQFRGLDDIRFRLLRAGPLEAGPLAGWRFGRNEDDGDRLLGLGDIDGGLIAGAFVAAKFGYIKPFLSYHHQVTGDGTGAVVRFGSEAEFKLDRGIVLTAIAGATYAGDDYMQHYFSISNAQAAASFAGLQRFDADAGIKDVYLSLSGTFPVSEHWTIRAGARYARLVGDAADSPIVESADQFSGSLGLSYRFGWGK